MRIKLFTIVLIFFATGLLWSQSSRSDSLAVHQTILDLFDGMRAGDSSKVAATFDPNVKMFTSYMNKEGELILKEGQLAPFLKAIGTPHDEIWDEKLFNTVIYVDVGIAQVWTEYEFYIGDKFSHCGVDAFHLVKNEKGEWKIVHLMDTRKRNACNERGQ